jgi:hypothetical protein
MNWFYAARGEQQGPISETELDRLIAQGVILPTTLVWREGFATWIPLQQTGARLAADPATAPDTLQCSSCLRSFESNRLVNIRGRRVCAGCKAAVLARFQEEGILPEPIDPLRIGPAWEDYESLGRFPAIRQTVRAVLTQPSRTFATMRRSGGLNRPFWYGTIVGGISQSILMVYVSIAELISGQVSHAFTGQRSAFTVTLFVTSSITRIVSAWISVPLGLFLTSGLLHLGLKLAGGARRPYETTFRAYCYNSPSIAVLNIIPVIGTLVAIPWSAVSICIALARAHETQRWRAVLALLLPLGLFLLFIVIFAMIIAFAVAAARNGR